MTKFDSTTPSVRACTARPPLYCASCGLKGGATILKASGGGPEMDTGTVNPSEGLMIVVVALLVGNPPAGGVNPIGRLAVSSPL